MEQLKLYKYICAKVCACVYVCMCACVCVLCRCVSMFQIVTELKVFLQSIFLYATQRQFIIKLFIIIYLGNEI